MLKGRLILGVGNVGIVSLPPKDGSTYVKVDPNIKYENGYATIPKEEKIVTNWWGSVGRDGGFEACAPRKVRFKQPTMRSQFKKGGR